MHSQVQRNESTTTDKLKHIGHSDKLKHVGNKRFKTLKGFLSILRVLIFESKVDRAIPNLAAAPEAPKTRPRDSVRAASIACFSSSAILCRSSQWFVGDARNGCRDIQLSSTEKLSLSETMTERSITFCSSRM